MQQCELRSTKHHLQARDISSRISSQTVSLTFCLTTQWLFTSQQVNFFSVCYICQPCDSGRGLDLMIILCKKVKSPIGVHSHFHLLWINCVSTLACSYIAATVYWPPKPINKCISHPFTRDFVSCFKSFGFHQPKKTHSRLHLLFWSHC